MAVSETTLTQMFQRFDRMQLANDRREVRVRTKTLTDFIANYAIIMWMYPLSVFNCGQVNGLADVLGVPFKSFLRFCKSIGCNVLKLKNSNGPEAFRITVATPLVLLSSHLTSCLSITSSGTHFIAPFSSRTAVSRAFSGRISTTKPERSRSSSPSHAVYILTEHGISVTSKFQQVKSSSCGRQ